MNSITIIFYKQWDLKRRTKSQSLFDFLKEVFKENIILTDKIESLFNIKSNHEYAWYIFDSKTNHALSLKSMSNQILIMYTSCAVYKHIYLDLSPKLPIRETSKICKKSQKDINFYFSKREFIKMKQKKFLIVKKVPYKKCSEKTIKNLEKKRPQNILKRVRKTCRNWIINSFSLIKTDPIISTVTLKKNRRKLSRCMKCKSPNIKIIGTKINHKRIGKKCCLQRNKKESLFPKKVIISIKKQNTFLLKKRVTSSKLIVLPKTIHKEIVTTAFPKQSPPKNYNKTPSNIVKRSKRISIYSSKIIKKPSVKQNQILIVNKNYPYQSKVNQIKMIRKNSYVKPKEVIRHNFQTSIKRECQHSQKVRINNINGPLNLSQNKITSTVLFPDGQSLGSICIENNQTMTAFHLLLLSGLRVTHSQGFISSINGVCNIGMSGWIFEVNHSPIMISAKDYIVQPNDHITWKYIDFIKVNQTSLEDKKNKKTEKRIILKKSDFSRSKK